MKTSIDHLPEDKQAQLRVIAELFRECLAVDKLILFGSYARGQQVEDRETGYLSDFDLCVVVDTEKQAADIFMWSELEKQARALAGRIPVTLIVHDIKFINHEIRRGQFFFSDIANEGLLLVDKRRYSLAKPKALNAAERLELAEYNFATWFDSATEFWRLSRYATLRNLTKHAAFLLHQATERYWHAAHLVFTGYKQQTHDIEKLGTMAAEQHALLVEAQPKTDPEDKRLFDLLKKAYIEARYSGSYRITQEELSTLQTRVVALAERVRTACLEKLVSLCGTEAVSADLPVPPRMEEPPLSNLPPLPEDPNDFAQWARSLAELSEQKGEVRGRQEGRAEGKTDTLRENILLVLRARGVAVSPDLEQSILACSDAATLAAWLKRAAIVARADQVLTG